MRIQKDKKPVKHPESEEDRLRRDVFRSDLEKFHLFTQMLRRNAMIKKATIQHR